MTANETVKMTLTTEYHRRADIEEFITKECLTEKRHQFLNTQRFQVWTKENLKGDGYEHFGKIKYFRDDLQAELTGLDFVFVFNGSIWDNSPERIRKAVLTHFLYRIEPLMDYEDENGCKKKCMMKDVPESYFCTQTYQVSKSGRLKFKIIKPFGEFPEVIKEFGDWNLEVRELKNSFKKD